MELGFKSDVGKKRPIDEDSIATIHFNSICNSIQSGFDLLIVADGMGGHNAGEFASSMAIKVVTENIFNNILHDSRIPDDELYYRKLLEISILKANRLIYQDSINNKERKGMGTTIVAALIINDILYVGNVGDSRAYILSNGKITQLTKDHSEVQNLVDQGEITKKEARNHPKKNIVTRIVGYYSSVKVDTFRYDLPNKNKILLCCDGLSDLVLEEEMKEIVSNSKNLQGACDTLVERANEYGGKDNISVILFQNITEKNILEVDTFIVPKK